VDINKTGLSGLDVNNSNSGQCPVSCFGISVGEGDCPAITVFV